MDITLTDIINDYEENPITSQLRDLIFGPELSATLSLTNLFHHVSNRVTAALATAIHFSLAHSSDSILDTLSHFETHLATLLESGVLVRGGVDDLLFHHPDIHVHRGSFEDDALCAIYNRTVSSYLTIHGQMIIEQAVEQLMP